MVKPWILLNPNFISKKDKDSNYNKIKIIIFCKNKK